MIAHAAINNLFITQFDIKTAFLYGDIDVDIYMQQPDGFDCNNGKVWKLIKSLYGSKQSPRQWCRKFTDFLKGIGLTPCFENPCVFFKQDPLVIVTIYVDDGIVFAELEQDIQHIMSQLRSEFEVHKMEVSTFLGFQIERPRLFQIILHQTDYINKKLNKYNSSGKDWRPERSPISLCKLTPNDAAHFLIDK